MKPEFFGILRSPVLWLALVFTAVLPLWLPSYYLHMATLALVYVGFAYAWNIVGGLTGQVSLAHSLFVGIGAMLASALLLRLGINMWVGMLIAALVSGMAGAVIAWVDYRFRLGHLSFALITLAFAEVGELVVLGWDFLGGASGLYLPKDQGNLQAFQFGGSSGYFWFLMLLAVLALGVNLAILNSPLGFFLRAIRGNEGAAQAVGVNVLRNKMLAMAISAVLCSLIGTAYARYLTFADPYLLASPNLTIEIVLLATIGGVSSAFGPLVGAGLLIPIGEMLRGHFGSMLPGLHYFIYGLLLVVVIIALPQGLAPAFSRLYRRFSN
ncbi:MAG: branched-chain amino acid ABC transporter permease [Magnetospirillum sp.]